ncbi:T9SS type A sorting domain-containing protein [Prevotellamassilia timonensis]|uniref:T9SS type A sorting domain-containing protein n=1 Tax=Prevotellamassilia timonensis TaxID=1852370 RepID=UPI00307A240F
MKQHILLTIISLLVFSAPAAAMASPVDPSAPLAESTEMQGINDEANHVDVLVSGTSIQVHAVNCQGATLKVYDIVGKLKYVAHIDSNDKTVRFSLGKGVYLLNINKTTRRISVAG